MPPGQLSWTKKLHTSINALKNHGWRSTNEFVEAFYADADLSAQSLWFTSIWFYAPEGIITAWMKQVPSGKSKTELNMAITRKATEIMISESTKAYHHPDLRISSSNPDIVFLMTGFRLQKL
jgi:hypothetical protein